MTTNLAERLGQVEKMIALTCAKAHRDRADITLVAVSKGQDIQAIQHAYELGLRDFGENYVQELIAKSDFFKSLGINDIRWHFLGALQRNKIKDLVSRVSFIHSLSSLKHAHYLQDYLTQPLTVFLQVNFENNPHRQGFSEAELFEAITEINTLQYLTIEGLMTVPPLDLKFSAKHWFLKMAQLKKEILAQGLLKNVLLSMGMSDDYIEAILCGSNVVRIGSAIFGPRKSR